MDRLTDSVRSNLARLGPQAALPEFFERWPEAVGPGIARNAWPSRVGKDGTVHVNTSDSVWAYELSLQASAIATRLGVAAVKFAPGPLPRDENMPDRVPPPDPAPEVQARAAEIASGIENDDLRASIERALGYALSPSEAGRPV